MNQKPKSICAGLTPFCARELKIALPSLPVAMFTPRPACEAVLRALSAGADGYLVRPIAPAPLLHALARLVDTGYALCDKSQALLIHSLHGSQNLKAPGTLSAREQQVLGCLLSGRPNKDICSELGITAATVHAHLSHIFRKLEVHTREQALRRFLRSR